MSDTTYLVTISKATSTDFEEIFSESADFDTIEGTLRDAYHAIHEDANPREKATSLWVGDFLEGEQAIVTKILDTMTTTSGKTFTLIELDHRRFVALEADKTYKFIRPDRSKGTS